MNGMPDFNRYKNKGDGHVFMLFCSATINKKHKNMTVPDVYS
jgi:hypothetical protein